MPLPDLTAELDASGVITSIDAINSSLGTLTTDLAPIPAKLDTIGTEAGNIVNKIDDLAVDFGVWSADWTDVKGRLADLPTADQWTAFFADVASIKAALEELPTPIGDIPGKLESIHGDTADIGAAITAAGAMPDLSTVDAKLTAIEDDLSHVDTGLIARVHGVGTSLDTAAGKALAIEIGELAIRAVEVFGSSAGLYLALFTSISDLLGTIISWLTSEESPPPDALITADAIASLRDTIRSIGLKEFTTSEGGALATFTSWLEESVDAIGRFIFQESSVEINDSRGNRIVIDRLGPPVP